MGILSQKPTAATLTQQLGEVQKQLNDARARRATLVATAENDQDYVRLTTIGGQIETLVAKEAKLRSEIADALERERVAEVDKAFDAAAAISSQEMAAGAELAKLISGIWPAVRKLIELDDKFVAAIPVRPPDWERHAFTANLLSLILNQLYIESDGRLRGTTGLVQSPQQLAQNPLFSIVGALREHLAMGLKARSNPQRDGLIAVQEQSGETAEQGE
jgi:hypothetical protein